MSGTDVTRSEYLYRGGIAVALVTLLLTLSFVGVVAIMTGFVEAFERRFPWYLLVGAVVFVVTMLHFEDAGDAGTEVMASVATVTVVAFAVVTLAGEGLLYLAANPREVLASQTILYFVIAALFCTGLAYWGIHHWREFR